VDPINLDELRSVEELSERQAAVRARLVEVDGENRGLPMDEAAQTEFSALVEEDAEIERRVTELKARAAIIERAAAQPGTTERTNDHFPPAQRSRQVADDNIYDLATIRASAFGNADELRAEMHGRARRAIELATFPHPDITSQDQARHQVTKLVEQHDDNLGTIARRILLTGSATYRRAFAKAIQGVPLNDGETRALSLAGASGGFAVPFSLDPTIIPTSNSNVNPFRAISRVIQIAGDEWRGVSSGAITAAYAAEATETTDNAPTLVQPTISTEKAQAFIPFSIEIGQDWGGLESEISRLLAEAKDDLEANKFTAGSGTNEPFGVLTGTTNTVNAGAGQTFTIANLYSLVAALPPRYRPNASFVASLAVINRIRQFDTQGGANLWVQLQADAPGILLGRPFYENSEMADVATSVKFAVYGDFSRFVIVDRVGLSVELIQHLVGTNHRPTGQRGLYAYWRNSAKVVDANAFRALLGVA
jgi:HK97 family phage major capsid protein